MLCFVRSLEQGFKNIRNKLHVPTVHNGTVCSLGCAMVCTSFYFSYVNLKSLFLVFLRGFFQIILISLSSPSSVNIIIIIIILISDL